jgi:hypothetical protein
MGMQWIYRIMKRFGSQIRYQVFVCNINIIIPIPNMLFAHSTICHK